MSLNTDLLNKILSEYLNVTRDKVPYVSGRTYDSIEGEVSEYRLLITAVDYAGVLEYGRRPGGLSEEGEANLNQWIDAKGLGQYREAIKWKIIREGTQLYRGDDSRYTKPSGVLLDQIPEIIDANEQLFVDLIRNQIEKTLTTEWYR